MRWLSWASFASLVVAFAMAALSWRSRPVIETFDIELGKSPLGGKGVFATRAFAKGEVVEEAPIMTAPCKKWGSALKDYLFTDTDPRKNVLVLGYGAMYNHADKPNLKYELGDEEDTFKYVAARDIEAGEELVISYGPGWWKSRTLEKLELA